MDEQTLYLDYEGLLRYHELIDAKKANNNEVVKLVEQSLTDAQKAQARSNIGAGTVTSTAHTITVKSGKKSDGTTDITATSSSATSPSVTLGNSGATAGAYGDTSNQTPSAGATFKVPSISVNAQGIVTAVAEHTVKIPAAIQNTDNTGIKLDTVSGTKKTDNTVIKAGSSTGLSIAGGTNKFSIGDGTNYIEVPITPSISNNVTGSAAWTASDKIVVTNASSGNAIKATSVAVGDLAPKASPALTGTPTAPTATAGTNNTQIATTAFVQNAISGITDAMVFVGTIGKATSGSGTISALPTSGVKIGHTYKIVDENKSIAAANSATGAAVTAKIGDTIVATDATPKWVVIPSGDEPSGTVTSIKIQATGPIAIDSDAAITSSGTRTISHDTSGVTANSYGPTADVNGANGNTIKVPQITVDAYGHITGVTERTYTSVNNTYTVNNGKFSVKGAGTEVASTTANASAASSVDIVAGNNVTVSPDATNNKITISATDTTYESKAAAANGTDLSLVTTGEKAAWNAKTSNTGTVTKVTAGTGLSIGTTVGGNFTTTGTINHTNSVTAQTTQAIYPIKIDAQGHISAYGSAVTIPTVNNATFSVKTKVGDATAVTAADFTANQSSADDVTFIQGDNVILTTNTTNRTITIGAVMPTISYGTLGSLTLDSTKLIDSLFIL